MQKPTKFALTITAVLTIGASSRAGLILHLDASAPGSDPNNIWTDLSPTGHHFSNDGATYNDADDSYDFVGDAANTGLTGPPAPNESAFDFTIDDPFSIVVYYKSTGNGRFTDTLINKTDDDFNAGWNLMATEVGGESNLGIVNQFMRASDNQDRAFRKAGEGQITANPFVWHMVMITVASNDNTTAAYEFYRDGDTNPMVETYDDEPSIDLPPITQDFPVRIGYENFSGSNPPGARFVGQIGIIEIWDETLPASYIGTRWNGGNPVRASGEPPPLVVVESDIATAIEISWSASNGVGYQPQFTDDLVSTNWMNLGTFLVGEGGTTSVFDSVSGVTDRSYRVIEL
jgi:hypothetical protein